MHNKIIGMHLQGGSITCPSCQAESLGQDKRVGQKGDKSTQSILLGIYFLTKTVSTKLLASVKDLSKQSVIQTKRINRSDHSPVFI